MKTFLLVLTIVLLFLCQSYASACDFDIDCEVGSKCVKQRRGDEGVCVGGLWPGNKNDDNRGYNNPDDSYGNTCEFNTDCDIGYKCVKDRGIEGTCMKRR